MTTFANERLDRRRTPVVIRTILIVEDNRETLELYGMAFESAGYGVSSATSVAEAMDRLRARRFDVLLSDYSLGDGTGVDVIERADDEGLLRATSPMICTSHPWVPVPPGVWVVHKPIGYDDLLDVVARQLARRCATAPHLH
jgi:DNA-binding NtrC family response regulator